MEDVVIAIACVTWSSIGGGKIVNDRSHSKYAFWCQNVRELKDQPRFIVFWCCAASVVKITVFSRPIKFAVNQTK